eukprot:1927037-Pleurochrysis_carterae.AAC.1
MRRPSTGRAHACELVLMPFSSHTSLPRAWERARDVVQRGEREEGVHGEERARMGGRRKKAVESRCSRQEQGCLQAAVARRDGKNL